MFMDAAIYARLQAPARLLTTRTLPESWCAHRHLALPGSRCTHAASALPAQRRCCSVAAAASREHAVQVVSASASAQRERISSGQRGVGTDAEDEDGHHERRASSSASDDIHVGAFVARKATFERIQGCGAIACLRSDK